MICSGNLHTVLVSEIGSKLEGFDLLPGLRIGVILAVFHCLGRVQDDNDLLKSITKNLATHSAYLRRKLLEMLVGLSPFLVPKFSKMV